VLLLQALAALSRIIPLMRRTDAWFDRAADELAEDPGTFWKRHRAKVVIFAVSLAVSSIATLFAERLNDLNL
jgi:hypothetical protein